MINGNDILIYKDGVAIAATRSNEAQTNCEMIEKASPTTGQWREFIAGRKDWSVNASFLASAVSNIQGLLTAGTPCVISFRDRSGNILLSGNAVCQQATYSAIRGNIANGTFIFVGNGELAAASYNTNAL